MGLDKGIKASATDVIDMTEVAAAVAMLNGEEPPSGQVFVPASIFQLSAQIEAEARKPGDEMADGTIYLGRFENETGKAEDWFSAAEDAKNGNETLLLTFNEAASYARDSRAHGHDDWIVPPGWEDRDGRHDILSEMFNCKSAGAFTGTYDEIGSYPFNRYWSSSTNSSADCAKVLRFSEGNQLIDFKSSELHVRLVRRVAVSGEAYGI